MGDWIQLTRVVDCPILQALTRAMFPVGSMRKTDVRALAKRVGLSNAERKDSVGVCFIGKRKFDEFLSQYVHATPGRFMSIEGKDIGKHKGAVYYTVGQRAAIPGAKQKYVRGEIACRHNPTN